MPTLVNFVVNTTVISADTDFILSVGHQTTQQEHLLREEPLGGNTFNIQPQEDETKRPGGAASLRGGIRTAGYFART